VSAESKQKAAFDTFLDGFIHPLVCGGTAVVRRPFSPKQLEHFGASLSVHVDREREIVSALTFAAQKVAPIERVPWPFRSFMALAMAGSNLAWVTDPKIGWASRRAIRRVLRWVDELTEMITPPRTRSSALVFHVILERLLGLRRPDVLLRSWAYTYRYLGRPSSTLLTRRVAQFRQEEHTRSAVRDLWAALDGKHGLDIQPRVERLARASPVTTLVRPGERFAFDDSVFGVLSDDVLRYGIVRELVRAGPAVATPLGRALRELAQDTPAPWALFLATTFIYERHVMAALEETAQWNPASNDPDEAMFFAVLPAALRTQGPFSAMLELAPADRTQVEALATQLTAAVGESAIQSAGAIITAARPPPRLQPFVDGRRDAV